ncbi:MAG TPA: MFS transporter [Micromonosporaceae bacterium]|nr:MFS transporter [Micromonosporaceae bacterium]HCU49741.1 MFS transporter [Micromonosporaceae bacterium]
MRLKFLLIAISLVGGLGSTAMNTTAGIWVMSLTGSESLAGLVGMGVFLPTLAGPLLGALADRLPRRLTLIWTDMAMAIVMLTLLTVREARQAWLIYLVMLLYGVSHVLGHSAESAILPALLPQEALGPLNGARTSAREGAKLVAPLLGAGLFVWQGGHSVALVCALALTISALLYARLPQIVEAPLEHSKGFARQGLHYLWQHAPIRRPVLAAGLCVALSGAGTAALYALVAQGLGKPPEFMGVLAAAQGAGSVIGGIAVGWALRRISETQLAGAGAAIYATGVLTQTAAAVPTAVTGAAFIGIGLPLTVIAAMTAVQRLTPPQLLGRVAGTTTTFIFAPVAIAIPLGSTLALGLNYQVILGCTGSAAIAIATYMFLAGSRSIAAA